MYLPRLLPFGNVPFFLEYLEIKNSYPQTHAAFLGANLSGFLFLDRPLTGCHGNFFVCVCTAPNVCFFGPPHQEYSIDITFCQTWYDERLRYNGSFESFVLNGNLVSQLWIPDTFFRNSKRIHDYAITMPSQMVRIHKDGKVLYTVRYVKPLESYLLGLFLPF